MANLPGERVGMGDVVSIVGTILGEMEGKSDCFIVGNNDNDG